MPACETVRAVERRELADLLLKCSKEWNLECPEYVAWLEEYGAESDSDSPPDSRVGGSKLQALASSIHPLVPERNYQCK